MPDKETLHHLQKLLDYSQRVLPEIAAVISELEADRERCWNAHIADPADQFWRRTWIRQAFANVEGLLNLRCYEVLSVHDSVSFVYDRFDFNAQYFQRLGYRDLLSIDEYDLVELPTYAKVKKPRVSYKNRFKVALKILVKFSGVDPDKYLDFNGEGWQTYLKAVDVRHKLTHPKRSIRISDEERACFEKGIVWYIGQLGLVSICLDDQFSQELIAFTEELRYQLKRQLQQLHR